MEEGVSYRKRDGPGADRVTGDASSRDFAWPHLRAEKQLAIASEFGLPHGTFRRKLREAVELLSACVLSVWAEVDEARAGLG
ncbi:MAG: hypothetical protein KBB95_09245 [Deltaproteobacteria bacterium]|jgi:hypothetical protein|nr:hypothetical protein [Deltaproteobacteria bacterium]